MQWSLCRCVYIWHNKLHGTEMYPLGARGLQDHYTVESYMDTV